MPQPLEPEYDLGALVQLKSDSPALQKAIADYRRRRGDNDWDSPSMSTPAPAYDPPRT